MTEEDYKESLELDPLSSIKDCVIKKGHLYKAERLWVPADDDLILDVIRQIHDQVAVGHPAMAKTQRTIARDYYWPGMLNSIRRYVRNCHVCKRAKAPRDKYNGVLKPLPVPERPWTDISMDYVTGLPEPQNGHIAILMVVNRLSKERHYIQCTAKDEGTTAEATAKLLIGNVWRYHGLPTSMISDRGPQFVSDTWKGMCKMLGIIAKLSIAFHPETDGQSEIVNQEMQRHLRSFTNYFQDNWIELLPMAEFAANFGKSEITHLSPFIVNRGYEPSMSFSLTDLSADTTRQRLANEIAKDITEDMEKVWDIVRNSTTKAQERTRTAADRHRNEVTYEEGDMVWLSTKNIETGRGSKKLDHKMIGPYRVEELIGSACRLKLPASMKIHDVFHTTLLRKTADDPLLGQVNEPPSSIIVDNKEE